MGPHIFMVYGAYLVWEIAESYTFFSLTISSRWNASLIWHINANIWDKLYIVEAYVWLLIGWLQYLSILALHAFKTLEIQILIVYDQMLHKDTIFLILTKPLLKHTSFRLFKAAFNSLLRYFSWLIHRREGTSLIDCFNLQLVPN